MSKVEVSTEHLRSHLAEQLEFLKASAQSFDGGFEAEAKRMAVTLRLLLHDNRSSKSLLGQLGMKDRSFISTAFPLSPNSLSTYSGLISIAMGPPKTRYVAMLDDVPIRNEKTFAEWWEEPVFIDDQKRLMTREQLIRTMANQDGGAHVDPKLDSNYHALVRDNSLNWQMNEGTGFAPMQDPARAAVRQIAHEVLVSLEPGYHKKIEHGASAIVAGMSITTEPAETLAVQRPKFRQEFGKVGRNSLCPCGSGKKFKHCHGHQTI